MRKLSLFVLILSLKTVIAFFLTSKTLRQAHILNARTYTSSLINSSHKWIAWCVIPKLSRLTQRPHYAGEISKRSFISAVRPTVHTNPSPKRHSNLRNLKLPAFRSRVDGKHFENRDFRKQWLYDNHVISLTEFYSNTNPKWPVIVAFLNSSGVVWTENIWCVFRVKSPPV